MRRYLGLGLGQIQTQLLVPGLDLGEPCPRAFQVRVDHLELGAGDVAAPALVELIRLAQPLVDLVAGFYLVEQAILVLDLVLQGLLLSGPVVLLLVQHRHPRRLDFLDLALQILVEPLSCGTLHL